MMMRRLHILTLLLILLAGAAQAEVVVVVHPDNPAQELSRRQLVDLYMGRTLYFPDGSLVLRIDQAPESSVRANFYRGLVDKSVAEVNAYWARLLFTGRASPPQILEDSQSVLKAVRSNRNAIGYIDSADVDNTVKVVGRVQ